jgi:arabinogalactan oligomer/maltooligosaccharide transport system substrate-binding protein
MCEAFAAAHPEASYQFDYGVVSEADARSRYSEDPEAAADVFMFPNDQLRELAQTSALYKVTRNKDDITARNMPGSIDAATYQDALYAYPMTADNGYFMYYDKSVFSEDDVKSLDQMLKVANEKGKKVYMDVSNGWYIASFFLGAGCNLTLDEAGLQVCDFNNADGLAAAEAIKAFTADPAFTTGDDTTLTGSIGGSLAAGVSGAWLSADVEAKLGENYAAVKLPTFTKGGAQVQMASFGGYKLIGVNSLTKSPVAAMDLADWLTNKENQLKRFAARSYGPSNTEASESPEVAENIALSALGAQNAFALPQNDVLGAYWNPAEAFGLAMEQRDYSKALQEMLDNMVAQITTV